MPFASRTTLTSPSRPDSSIVPSYDGNEWRTTKTTVPAITRRTVARAIPLMMTTRSRRRTDPTVENPAARPKWGPSQLCVALRSVDMNPELVYVPVPVSELDRIRCNGHDDFGNAVVSRTAGGGEPLRCCLTLARAGDQIALVSHR